MDETILQWGLDCIRLIQGWANPPLTLLLKIITTLGSSIAYLILIPLSYWCIGEKKSLRLGAAVFVSVWVNFALKFLLDQPRPFFEGYDPAVGMMSAQFGGFPSAHAQNSLVMWIIIASWGNKKWQYCAAAVFCLLIGFSRIYLGLHFPTDVLGGWVIGGLILCGYFFAAGKIEAFIAARSPRVGVILCTALAFVMILYRPSAEMLMPGGMLLGLGTGYFLYKRYIETESSKQPGRGSRRLILCGRFVLGIAGMVLLYMGLGRSVSLFYNTANYELVVFVRFVLLALWVSAGAPWLFGVLRLTVPADD